VGEVATPSVFAESEVDVAKSDEVEILRRGDEIVLREKRKGLARAFEILASLPDDFLPDGRRDTPPQERGSHA